MTVKTTFSIRGRNPDVLTCIANLSNDEVFTPPELANKILDDLAKRWAASNEGQDIWSNPDITFLDPFTKSGVFLREITSRLTEGLERVIPDLSSRVDHILSKQVFGLGLTQLTSQLARRSLYCSKEANSEHSIARSLSNPEGNIWFERTEHVWEGGFPGLLVMNDEGETVHELLGEKCSWCGASRSTLDRGLGQETHAYALLHTNTPTQLLQSIFGDQMQFDVIIGNPPYQLSLGNTGSTSATAKAIYHEFVSRCMDLNPRMLSMVIPSRWMTRSTKGVPDSWIDDFINDKRVRVLNDYLDSTLVFPGVDIKGGVCYFLWDRDNPGKCEYVLHKNNQPETSVRSLDYLNAKGLGVVLREVEALSIIEKIERVEGKWFESSNSNFSSMVSPKDFFTNKELLTTNWNGFSTEKTPEKNIKYYMNKSLNSQPFGFVSLSDIPKNSEVESYHKVYVPASGWGSAMEFDDPVLGKPFVGEPHSVCSQTYLVVGYDQSTRVLSAKHCENISAYMSTKFFRFLVSLKKHTQQAARGVYQFVPIQDFDHDWSDAKLYKKYDLDQDEISLIEQKIRAFEPIAN